MLHENALGLSTIVWRGFKKRIQSPQRMARVILKRSDMRRFVVSAKSHLSLYLVLQVATDHEGRASAAAGAGPRPGPGRWRRNSLQAPEGPGAIRACCTGVILSSTLSSQGIQSRRRPRRTLTVATGRVLLSGGRLRLRVRLPVAGDVIVNCDHEFTLTQRLT
jgi:hypothetical protein